MRRILMIAYHFPPLAGSSGIQRTLRFVQHLPSFGWEALVLTVHPRAYAQTSQDLMRDIPQGTVVERAFGLDTARHLSLGSRYIGWMARPDRWVSWRLGAVPTGLKMIKEYQPDVIWSTYPIATAHLIGSRLHRLTGVPWVADFRDPMAQDGYPADPKTWQQFHDIEKDAAYNANLSTFTTPGTVREYQKRYPEAAHKMVLLENGYDEETFTGLQIKDSSPLVPGRVVLLHSGIVYPSERDPRPLFQAIQRLAQAGRLQPSDVQFRFRASHHEDLLRSLGQEYGIMPFIDICPPIPYRDALVEMMRADGLLVMQSNGCNDQIPAKIYEYLRAGRPMLCLADPIGDTAGVMKQAGLPDVAALESADDIAALLPEFLARLRQGQACLPQAEIVQQASRRQRAAEFVPMLERIISKH